MGDGINLSIENGNILMRTKLTLGQIVVTLFVTSFTFLTVMPLKCASGCIYELGFTLFSINGKRKPEMQSITLRFS